MKRIAATLTAATMLLALSAPAWAADAARLNILGFSPDASVFAFEEFGIQDGSGFPYSNIYFINTETDSYLPGTPIRVLVQDEENIDNLQPVSRARDKAMSSAAELMVQYKIADLPGIYGAFNPMSQVNVDEKSLSYYPVQTDPAFGPVYTLTLEEKPFPLPANCENLTESYGGFKLKMAVEGGESPATVYEDTHVPSSRGCVTSYRLGGVALTGDNFGPHMAMVEIRTFGFEGHDARWIAVPVKPQQ